MDLIKNLLKYLFILVGIAAFILIILASIMFFVPSVTIFGYRFRDSHNSYVLQLQNLTEVNTITVKTNAYNIRILPNTDSASPSDFRIVIKNNYVGFVNSENETLLVNNEDVKNFTTLSENAFLERQLDSNSNPVIVDDEEVKIPGSYVFDLTEVSGIMTYGNSTINIYVPQTFGSVDYNLETNKGVINFAKNTENTYQKVSTGNINIKVNSNRGSFSLDNVNMKSTATLDVKNYLGRIKINSDIGGSVKISSKTGSFLFNNIGSSESTGIEDSTLSSERVVLLISGDNPYVTFNNLNGSLKFTSKSGTVEGNNVSGDIITETEGGFLRINKMIGGALISTTSGEVKINQIGNESNLERSINISTQTGNINLGGTETEGAIFGKISSVTTKSGKITLNNVKNDLNRIESTSGSININFEKSNTIKNAVISSNSGAINISNINGEISASTSNSSAINASYYLIGGASNFTTDNGNINLTLVAPTDEANKQYELKMMNKSDKVDVKIGAYELTTFNGIEKVDGYYVATQSFPTSAENPFVITSKTNSGKITIRN